MPIYINRHSVTEQPIKRRSGHTKPKPPLIPITTPGRYSVGNVMAVSGWSHSKLMERIREGRFPAPMKDGRISYWPTDIVRSALGL